MKVMLFFYFIVFCMVLLQLSLLFINPTTFTKIAFTITVVAFLFSTYSISSVFFLTKKERDAIKLFKKHRGVYGLDNNDTEDN